MEEVSEASWAESAQRTGRRGSRPRGYATRGRATSCLIEIQFQELIIFIIYVNTARESDLERLTMLFRKAPGFTRPELTS